MKKYGPELGDLYFQEDVAWDQVMKKLRTFEEEAQQNSETESVAESINPVDVEPRLQPDTDSENQPGNGNDFSVSPLDGDETQELEMETNERIEIVGNKKND